MPALEVDGLRKCYGDLVAVDDISFGVAPGELFGILGPNGAGKTTTLEMIEGLRHPDAGRITILGLELHADALLHATALPDAIEAQYSDSACGRASPALPPPPA